MAATARFDFQYEVARFGIDAEPVEVPEQLGLTVCCEERLEIDRQQGALQTHPCRQHGSQDRRTGQDQKARKAAESQGQRWLVRKFRLPFDRKCRGDGRKHLLARELDAQGNAIAGLRVQCQLTDGA